jgi:iron only hydrogenase large subunit-like protein
MYKGCDTNARHILCCVSGWVCYAEKTHGEFILPYISTTRSPQQIMGALAKNCLASHMGLTYVKHCAGC